MPAQNTNPNELVERWRERMDMRDWTLTPHDCADELESALAWHPMTVEPKGGDGVTIVIDPLPEADRCICDWSDEDDQGVGWWDSDTSHAGPSTWYELVRRYPNATWCYLPRRKNNDD